MGLGTIFAELIGFGLGIPIGVIVGYFVFFHCTAHHGKGLEQTNKQRDKYKFQNLIAEVPLWVKCPDYERIDWFNKFIFYLWPFLDKAICHCIRATVQPMFVDFSEKYMIQKIEFEHLSLGNIPPIIHGLKTYETTDERIIIEPALKWAGNAKIVVAIQFFHLTIRIQLIDLLIDSIIRISLQPLVNLTFIPLQPKVDFGLMVQGADIMSIPGLLHLVREYIENQIASVCLWPETYQINVLDSTGGAVKKPVGILHVRIVRAMNLLKADFLGKSDPYVSLILSGDNKLYSKKTTVKKNTLNPEWNETFKMIVRDLDTQSLHLQVFDWDKVGAPDKLGIQTIPLHSLTPYLMEPFSLDLQDDACGLDPNGKRRGQIVVELIYVPFVANTEQRSDSCDGIHSTKERTTFGGGLLSATVHGANNLQGKRHMNPYARVIFRGEKRRTKVIHRCPDPKWEEEFQYTLDEPPLNEKIVIDVQSKRHLFSLLSKERLGHVEVKLDDIVENGRINNKYSLIQSRKGVIHIELQWSNI